MCTTGHGREMEYPSLDPYEQQLFKVFDSYDFDNKGSLDKEGLTQLCCTLQLEEQGNELVQHLLHDPKSSRVTFTEFKEALLTLLGNVQNRTQTDDKGSPDREVSPKYVYGTKKYGRRSRPKNDDQVMLEGLNENTNYTNKITYNTSVQRSNSQSDVLYSKKRKTNTKLKRCTSFPGSHDLDFHKMSGDVFVTNGFNNDQEFLCTEEMLRQAWEKLGVGDDGYLNQTELVLVCDAIGLHRLAKGVIRHLSDKLRLDVDHKISFQELLEALQQDDTWSEVLNPTSPTVVDDTLNLSTNCLSESHFPGSDIKIIQHITLGPDGTGFINSDVVLELWENVGISSPKLLLQELGFGCSQIKVAELASALEKEIKSINETKGGFTNPHIVLLQAVLSLYRSEIRCLKNILEQMCAERDKLKHDVCEANNRATMLAQEVDDNHARMEQNTQQQVKLLEQKHADVLKELTVQFAGEKEQMSHQNQNLEQKILCLESEEAQLRNDLQLAQEYSVSIDKENQILNNQISELQQVKNTLNEQISILESDKHNYEYENQQARIEPLLQQLSSLQIENSQLRDKNDEMLSEIESLNNQICVLKNKSSSLSNFSNLEESMEENVSIVCEGVGLGSKRRSDDSPSKDLNVLGLGDGSPRLGKVRKCHKTKSENLEVPITSSESGFDTELDALDSSLSLSVNDSEEISKLQIKIMRLEDILKQHGIPISSNVNCTSEDSTVSELKVKQLTKRCTELQDLIISVQRDLSKMLAQNPGSCTCDCTTFSKILNNRLTAVIFEKDNYIEYINDLVKTKNTKRTEVSNTDNNLQDQIQKYVKENEELVNKCSELENCIEDLRNEYERCEDYWSSKLDDERLMFEQEQNQSSEKLTELIGKMAEYEAQFSIQDETDYRLPPIEEKYSLEKQFTDLEQEFEEYKEHAEFQIAEKANEIADLKEKLTELNPKNLKEVGVQVSCSEFQKGNSLEDKLNNLSNCVIESTNIFSAETMPFGWSSAKPESGPNSIDTSESHNHVIQREYVNPTFVWNKSRQANSPTSTTTENLESNNTVNHEINSSWRHSPQTFSIVSLPSTSAESASTVTDNNSIPSRPKRTRKHNKNCKVQRLTNKDDSKNITFHNNNVPNSSVRWKPNNTEEMVTLPIAVLHNFNCRLHHLEQRKRQLQIMLRQQHYHAEQMLQSCWQQYRGEKAELQYLLKTNQEKLEHQMRVCNDQLERLTKTDILVKDLYVENSYLVANVQRLEKQCHMLTQYNSASSSV
ncbi:hypothetical protein RI129_006015 [Pyrocoelia pectoralis]|uniref:EF-hand domain-containing protein n=1 Tax=Pyrocoelia pectoralis TaxID=417401 RepID=A0AAN7VAG7_9COLE